MPLPAAPDYVPPPPRAWWALPLGVLLALALLGAGLRLVYQEREQRYRHQVEEGLNAINHLQLQGVAQWRSERLADAQALSEDALWTQAVHQWQRAPTPALQQALAQRLRTQVERRQYSGAYLVDTQGRVLLQAGGTPLAALAPPEAAGLPAALETGEPRVIGLRREPVFGFAFYSLLAPLYDGDTPLGAIWLVMDARASLYPLLASWPGTNRSGESLLLRREADALLVLSPLRERADAPLTQRLPVGVSPTPALADQVEHVRGHLYALDGQGQPVLASVGAVPGSDWLLVSKIDEAEALTEGQRREWLTLGALAAACVLVLGGLVVLWQWRGWQQERGLRARLQANVRWLEAAQRSAKVGYFAYDPVTQAFTLSTQACEIYGLASGADMTLRQWVDLLHAEDRKRVLKAHEQARRERSLLAQQYRIVRPHDQAVRWVQVWGASDEGGAPMDAVVTGTVQDITERRSTEEQLAHYRQVLELRMRTDALTRVANRMALDEAVAHEWSRAHRQDTPLALLMIDVDLFKAFNDHYGHRAGDQCLQAVAGALASSVGRAGDLVARYGGEEFAALLPGADETQAFAVAQRLRQAVRALAVVHAWGATQEDIVTISVGVASLRPRAIAAGDGASGQDAAYRLFWLADAALYRAKQLGRDRACIYGPDSDDALHPAPDHLFGSV